MTYMDGFGKQYGLNGILTRYGIRQRAYKIAVVAKENCIEYEYVASKLSFFGKRCLVDLKLSRVYINYAENKNTPRE